MDARSGSGPVREGAIWENLLTDKDGQYTELQSGRAFQQPRPPCEKTPFKVPSFAPAGRTSSRRELGNGEAPRGLRTARNRRPAGPVKMPRALTGTPFRDYT
jgi:hypothetical protein